MIGLKKKPANPVTNFVSTILQHFPPYRWEEAQEKTWMETMIRELNGCDFSDAVLEKALTDMVRTRKDRRIPLVAECITACLEARKWLAAKEGAENLPIQQQPKSIDERTKLADDLIMGKEGRLAAKEGWILGLHDYARKHGKLPPPSEFERLRRQARGDDEAYARVVRGDGMFVAREALEKLGAAMQKRRNELADRVLNGSR